MNDRYVGHGEPIEDEDLPSETFKLVIHPKNQNRDINVEAVRIVRDEENQVLWIETVLHRALCDCGEPSLWVKFEDIVTLNGRPFI